MFISLVNLICLSRLISSVYLSDRGISLNQTQSSSSLSTIRYLVGNLSEPFSFDVAPSNTPVTYLGLNGDSLFIKGVGFSNKSKFHYDEEKNRLTIVSLDLTTVGFYSAVDSNWKTFNTILTAINGKRKDDGTEVLYNRFDL